MEAGQKVTFEAPVRIIRPPATLDMEAAADLKSSLVRMADWRKKMIVLDMSGVTYLDTLPLVVIVTAAKRARKSGSHIVLAGLQGQPREVVEEWAADPPIEVFETPDDAAAALGAHV